ncbi:TetR/AcrR family transcriptional regulator [Sulfurimonas paralvinellae]|uniref:TetR/AcrR family transcriptional regulator n=1 Tax=Sulfurimonas paralvinellae TaxID=317658 RepID=A0A7M1B870_9BACT|nr:TetR/AcrR family transcriptional regulator [Sulfurimonas paralvinellae]QOP45821.1 TetR/AcrR family transcriptional regulator [Sulfurimonas paralvinellae]
MAKQTRDAEATKAKIIENAMLLFAKNGYDATTADEIAKECGVNKAMLFYYYKNKAGLYAAVMTHALEAIHNEIIVTDKCCVSPLADLEAFIKTYAAYCDKNPYLPSLILRELSDSGAHLPELMFASLRKLFMLLSEILREGEKQGLFHDIEPMIIHFMIVGTINLLITTKPLRENAAKMEPDINTCSDCDIDEIAAYIFKKVKLMLEIK